MIVIMWFLEFSTLDFLPVKSQFHEILYKVHITIKLTS
jgi:hypothetical protein